MTLIDDLRSRLFGTQVADIQQPEEDVFKELSAHIKKQAVFPPPLPGSIPQGDVYPDVEPKAPVEKALSFFDRFAKTPEGQANVDMGKAILRNVVGIPSGVVQAARHPLATALDVPLEFTGGAMSAVELLPGIDQVPGHPTVERARQYLRGRIASDAPFKEAGQYAQAVPEMLSFAGPFAGASRLIPAVRQAGGVGAALSATMSAANKGRAVLERSAQVRPELSIMDGFLRVPRFAEALKWIEHPQSAPTPELKAGAFFAKRARDADFAQWDNLTRLQQERLDEIGQLAKSTDPDHVLASASLRGSVFKSGLPQAGAVQDFRLAERARGARLSSVRAAQKFFRDDPQATQYVGSDPLAQMVQLSRRDAAMGAFKLAGEALKEKALDNVRRLGEYAFSRPGTMRVLAGKAIGQEAKTFLRTKLPQYKEIADAWQKAYSAASQYQVWKFMSVVHDAAGGDEKEIARLTKQALNFIRKGRSLPNFPVEVQNAAWELRSFLKSSYDETARLGVWNKDELLRIRNMNDAILGRTLRAAHTPNYLAQIKDSNAWNKVFNVIQKAHPNANRPEIEGLISQLVSKEVAQHIEETGKFPKEILQHPLMQGVQRSGFTGLDVKMPMLLGRIRDLPTVAGLAGETISRAHAERLVKGDMIEAMRQIGMSSQFPKIGSSGEWINIRKSLGLGHDLFVPPEMADWFPQMEPAARHVQWLMHQLIKGGAIWRTGSTVASPLTITRNSLSNFSGMMMNGTILHPASMEALRHSTLQSASALTHEGVSIRNPRFEKAVAMHGLGVGTVAGEMGTVFSTLGMTPRVAHETEVFPSLLKLGVSPESAAAKKITSGTRKTFSFMRHAFEQGDIMPKRVVAQIHASEFYDMLQGATPGDIANIFEKKWGSTNPGLIAADMTSNEMQSYQRGAQAWKDLGKSPAVGLFSSFPAESARNFSWNLRYLIREIDSARIAESPVVRQIMLRRAMRRFTGMSMSMKMLTDMGRMVSDVHGPTMTDKQKEAFAKVVLPEWDKGPHSIIAKKGHGYTYVPESNLEYYQNTRTALQQAGAMLGAAANGEWNRVDDAGVGLLTKLSDDLLQWQQPARGIVEAFGNQRFGTSPVSWAIETARGKRPVRLSSSADPLTNIGERFTKGMLPGLAPTPLRQIGDVLTGKRGILETLASPAVQIKNVDSEQQLRIAGSNYADERQQFNKRIAEILRREIPDQDKAHLIAKERDAWNNDFGPRLVENMQAWHQLHSTYDILTNMKELGEISTREALHGRVPRFDRVFHDIPPRVRFYLRGE